MTSLLVLVLASLFTTALAAADVSGVWSLDFDPDFSGHRSTGECTFKQAGKKLTGACGTDSPAPTPVSGEVDEPKVVFQFKTGKNNELSATFTATLDEQGKTMQGTWSLIENGKKRDGRFEARRR
jgi:hypothetical protein